MEMRKKKVYVRMLSLLLMIAVFFTIVCFGAVVA